MCRLSPHMGLSIREHSRQDLHPMTEAETAWNLYIELRKEIVATQHLRSAVVGLKITFVSAAIGFILANKMPVELLAVPALAAIAFDCLIIAATRGIKRKGKYCRDCLEPKICDGCSWRNTYPFWEGYLVTNRSGASLPLIGNAGMTLLAIAPAIVCLAAGMIDSWAVTALVFVMGALFSSVSIAYVRSEYDLVGRSLPHHLRRMKRRLNLAIMRRLRHPRARACNGNSGALRSH
jgi:hypothetical protein